jgi:hypothetical protein
VIGKIILVALAARAALGNAAGGRRARNDSFPVESPRGGRIAFVTELKAVGLGALLVLFLTVVGATSPASAARHDGPATNGRIAFPGIGGLRLDTLNPDGSGAWPIAIGRFVDPAYSADGSSIALQSDGVLWTYTAAGQPERQLTEKGIIADHPSWSPDGTMIAFDEALSDTPAIRLVNADGTNQHTLYSGACVDEPSWSPDGGKLAFQSCPGGDYAIWTISADGTNPTQLTSGASDELPSWSPDGRWIAFDRWQTVQGWQIWIVRNDRTDAHHVTSLASPSPLAWAPDSTQIAYISDGDIFVTDLNGNVRGPIATGAGQGITWQPRPSTGQTGCTESAGALGDVLVAKNGSNVLCGGPGADVLRGGSGDDILRGGDGGDRLVGGAGDNILLGGPGNDLLDARDGFGGDIVDGGPGIDTCLIDHGDTVHGCERVERVEPRNLARNRPVTASFSFADGPPELAVDAQHTLWWASYYAPQWIEIDLGRPSAVRELQLQVAQTPAGQTLHVVYGGPAPDPQRVLHTFSGLTQDGDVLDFRSRTPWRNVRYVRVTTWNSPSWVAWKEIRILR